MSNHARKVKLAELKVAGELSDVQWMVLTASVAGLFMAMATLRDRKSTATTHVHTTRLL